MKHTVTLDSDRWEDVLDFIGFTAFDDEKANEFLQAYGIELIEEIKEQVYES